MSVSKKQFFFCVVGFALTVGAFLAAKAYQTLIYTNPYEQFLTNGYDFRGMQDADEDFSRLKVGEIFDIGKIVTTRQTKLDIKGNLVLIAIVDPKCAFCMISSDIFAGIRIGLPDSVLYIPAVFNRNPSEFDLNEFGTSIGFQEMATWENNSRAPELLSRMPTPAHILFDRDGTVLQVWFSSSRDKDIRNRMTEQILHDILLIDRVYPAIKIKMQESSIE